MEDKRSGKPACWTKVRRLRC